MALTNRTAWAVQMVVESVAYAVQRMRFAPFVNSRVVPYGTTLKFPIPPSGGTVTPTGLDLPAGTPREADSLELNPLTRQASQTIELDDDDVAQVVGGEARTLPLLLTGQLDAMAAYVDRQIYETIRPLAGGYAQVNDLPNAPTAAFASSGDNLAALRNVYRQYQVQDVDPDTAGITLVISDDDYRELLGYPNIIQAQVRGDAGANRTGRIQNVLGIDTILGSNRINAATRTGTAARAVNNSGGYPVLYRGPITFDGSGGVAPAAGDVVRLGTENTTYIVRSVSGATMRFTRPLSAAIRDNDAITPLGGPRPLVGLAFTRRSVAFATRVLKSSSSGSITRVTATDPSGSISMRLTVEEHTYGIRAGYDLMHDQIVLQPQEIVQLGSAPS